MALRMVTHSAACDISYLMTEIVYGWKLDIGTFAAEECLPANAISKAIR